MSNNKKSFKEGADDAIATILGLLVFFGPTIYCILALIGDGAVGGLLVFLAFIVIVAIAAGAKDAFSPIEIPKNDAAPPPGLAKMEKQSPGGIETQMFEGGYDGSLNKEFEEK